MVEKNCNKDDTYTQWEEADIVSVQLTFSQLTCPSGNACDLKQDVKYLRVLMRCFRAAFSVYESLYMCFSANTLPHFFGLIKFFFGSWLSEKWKMPLTPHSLGLHKLLGLFSPAVRPIINRSVLDAFVWISYSLQIQEKWRLLHDSVSQGKQKKIALCCKYCWPEVQLKLSPKKSDSFCFIMMITAVLIIDQGGSWGTSSQNVFWISG